MPGESRLSFQRLNDHGRSIAKHLGCRSFAHDLRRIVAKTNDRVSSDLFCVLQTKLVCLLACLFAHCRIGADSTANNILKSSDKALSYCGRSHNDPANYAFVFFDCVAFNCECCRHLHLRISSLGFRPQRPSARRLERRVRTLRARPATWLEKSRQPRTARAMPKGADIENNQYPPSRHQRERRQSQDMHIPEGRAQPRKFGVRFPSGGDTRCSLAPLSFKHSSFFSGPNSGWTDILAD